MCKRNRRVFFQHGLCLSATLDVQRKLHSTVMNKELRKAVTIRSARTVVAVAVVLAGLAVRGHADDSRGDVWLISTRRAPRCGQLDRPERNIDYWRLEPDGQWQPADPEAFVESSDRAVPTTVFVHGNRTGRTAAIQKAWHVYRRMKHQAGGRPFRLVIWSWPSDRIRGRNRRDVQVKASYSDVQGYYLAECLDRLDPQVPVSLIGYSFGARIITGGLHLMAGGSLAGRSLGERAADGRRPIRVVLVAAALDVDWLSADRPNGRALSQVQRILVTHNCCDPVLRWYPLLYCRRGPQAMGFAGPICCRQSGTGCEKIELLDTTCSVGRIHDWTCYVEASGLRRRLGWYTFLESPAGAALGSRADQPDE